MSERRIRNNRMRRRRQQRRNLSLAVFTIILILCVSFTSGSFLSRARTAEEESLHKYYASVMVQCGDTLWSIASEHMDDGHYEGRQAYIDEVVRINSLDEEKITAGNYLIIPYYE